MAKHFQVDTNGTLTTSLVSYWKMDGDSTDYFGSHNGTDTSMSYSTTTKKITESASFNGSSSKIAFASTDTMPTSRRSFFCWIYVNSFNTLGQPILCGGSGSTNNADFFRTGCSAGSTEPSSDRIAFEIWGHSSVYSNAGHLTAATWHHVGYVWDGTNITLYIDGVDQTASRGGSNITPVGWALNNGALGFAFGGSTSNGHMNGFIDEPSYWSKALSSQEITDLYNSGSGQTMVSTTTHTQALTQSATATVSLAKASVFAKALSAMATGSISLVKAATHFLTLVPKATATEASYSETHQSGYFSIDSTAAEVGQAFIAPKSGTLTSAKFYTRQQFSPSGSATARLYAATGTPGTNAVPTGSALAISDSVEASTLPISFTLVSFAFTGANQYALNAGTTYCISLNYGGSNEVDLGEGSASLPSNSNAYFLNGSSYDATDLAGNAACYYIYADVDSPASAAISLTYTKLKLSALSVTATASLTLARLASHFKTFSETASANISLAKIKTAFKTFSETATASVSLSQLHTAYRTLSASATSVVSLAKGLLKDIALTVSAAGSATLAKARIVMKVLTTSATAVVSLAALSAQFITMAVTATASITLTKFISLYRTFSVAATSVISITRGGFNVMVFAVSGVASVSLAKTATFLKTLSKTATAVISVARQSLFSRALTATATASVSLAYHLFHSIALSVTATVSTTLSKGKIYFKTFVQSATAVVSVSKALTIAKTLSVTATAKIKLFINGLQSIFMNKYVKQATSFLSKFTSQGTIFTDKYEHQATQFKDKYQ